MLFIFNGGDDISGASLGASHTADTFFLVYQRNTIHNGDGVILANVYTGAIAQTAEFAGDRSVTANLRGGQTVLKTFVLGFFLGAVFFPKGDDAGAGFDKEPNAPSNAANKK